MTVPNRAVGVDVGGTFTDVVSWDESALRVGKVPSTKNQSEAVAAAVEGIASGLLLHGTTVATNALLERKGARTALITTPGFEDAIEIGRQERPSLYDANSDRAPTLVERSGRHGFVSDQALHGFLEETNPESVAIALLDAFADNSAEETIAAKRRHLEKLGSREPVVNGQPRIPRVRAHGHHRSQCLSPARGG